MHCCKYTIVLNNENRVSMQLQLIMVDGANLFTDIIIPHIAPRAPFPADLVPQVEVIVPHRHAGHDKARLTATRHGDFAGMDRSDLLLSLNLPPSALVYSANTLVADLVCLGAEDGVPAKDELAEVLFSRHKISGCCFLPMLLDS
mmetsp:Transcript_37202/g.56774  ORF Transcript_37202/g.56774 Transcript_37202/m.56774 type:complete len:145 (+) Transcript_37202:632-1066(+)